MAKVHPTSSSSSSSSLYPPLMSSERQVFTIWMKSLVLNGYGCTIYDSKGLVVYRMDNYDSKSSHEVFFMNSSGKTLFKILKKNVGVFGQWRGYRSGSGEEGMEVEEKKPWFTAKKTLRVVKRDGKSWGITVMVGSGSDGDEHSCYKIHGSYHNKGYKITNFAGDLIAEVKRKETEKGVVLGEDVLNLVIEPNSDQMLIMGLVVVCGLTNHSL
ncbi:LURP-one-related protein [Dioscorea alata]|uniref:LURP-one-related protein n=1 Tax=Dioscorea alata TaxID=55571 RepID=A0ACB7VVH3_DIOAL|nr:LURP-one-related protein [Dioscorea alata]